MKVELDLSNCATKTDLKECNIIDISSFAKKDYVASLKSNVDKLDIETLKNLPTKLNNFTSKVDKLNFDKLNFDIEFSYWFK